MRKIIQQKLVFLLFMLTPFLVYAQDTPSGAGGGGAGAFQAFVTRITMTGSGVGIIVSVIAYTLAGIMFLIAGWNMYKKSKNPNGNEGAIILGAVIAGSILLAIPTVANIGQDGLFGDEDPATQLNFG
jgi:hypothetical protein